jgi:hypothetical protein
MASAPDAFLIALQGHLSLPPMLSQLLLWQAQIPYQLLRLLPCGWLLITVVLSFLASFGFIKPLTGKNTNSP